MHLRLLKLSPKKDLRVSFVMEFIFILNMYTRAGGCVRNCETRPEEEITSFIRVGVRNVRMF